jgi:hypothetical protein
MKLNDIKRADAIFWGLLLAVTLLVAALLFYGGIVVDG